MMIKEDFDPKIHCRPNPIVTFASVWAHGQKWQPAFGDRSALLILKRITTKQVSFPRAYAGYIASGAVEEKELGQGRAFLRWLQKHDLSVEWKERDFNPHPYFTQQNSPTHEPQDEMARGLSFAVRPVSVLERKVKLYLKDEDMMSLLSMPYGREEDFLELVMMYVTQRFEWEAWRAPAPSFLDWIISHGKRPIFLPGQLGMSLLR